MEEEILIDKRAGYPGTIELNTNPKTNIPVGLRVHYNGYYDENLKMIPHNFQKSFEYFPLSILYLTLKENESKLDGKID